MDKLWYNLIALLWVLVLLVAWFLGINILITTDPSKELAALIGGGLGVFTTLMTLVAQHIWRKKPGEP